MNWGFGSSRAPPVPRPSASVALAIGPRNATPKTLAIRWHDEQVGNAVNLDQTFQIQRIEELTLFRTPASAAEASRRGRSSLQSDHRITDVMTFRDEDGVCCNQWVVPLVALT
jgi:hypothetical protein